MSTFPIAISIIAFALLVLMLLPSPRDGTPKALRGLQSGTKSPLHIIGGASQLVPQRRKNGFTLIELMVVIAILGIAAAVVIPWLGNLGSIRGSQEKAEANARAYYAKMYDEYKSVVVSCASSDSDGDGYVSCSGRGTKTEGGDKVSLPAIQCGGGGIAAAQRGVNSCKPTVGLLVPQQ